MHFIWQCKDTQERRTNDKEDLSASRWIIHLIYKVDRLASGYDGL